MKKTLFTAIFYVFCNLSSFAHAAEEQSLSIQLIAIMGSKVSVSINGKSPKMMDIGSTRQNIKLISIQAQNATFAIPHGQSTRNINVLLGHEFNTASNKQSTANTPTSSAIPPNQNKNTIVIKGNSQGMFYTDAIVNGVTLPFMVDTGASNIDLTSESAQKIGLNYEQCPSAKYSTGNTYFKCQVPNLTVQGITFRNVNVSVVPLMTTRNLLGYDFTKQFHVSTKNNQVTLKLR